MSQADQWIRGYCELHRQIKSMRAALRAAAKFHDLSDAQATLLLLCSHTASHGLAQQEMAKMTAMSPAAVSAHLESLRQQGLVTSRRAPNDRRRQLWASTEQGMQFVVAMNRQLNDHDHAASAQSLRGNASSQHRGAA